MWVPRPKFCAGVKKAGDAAAIRCDIQQGKSKGTISLPGGSAAVYTTGGYNGTGLNFIRHKDWLGSSRLATTWNHAVYSKEAYAPFGEAYNEAGTPDRSFTGQDQNVATGSGGSGAYDFLFRKYDPSAGRWLSPDPDGWAVVNQADPQSLDRYAYVENQPLSSVDQDGLIACVSSDGTEADSGNPYFCQKGWTPCDQSPVCVQSFSGDCYNSSQPGVAAGCQPQQTQDPNNPVMPTLVCGVEGCQAVSGNPINLKKDVKWYLCGNGFLDNIKNYTLEGATKGAILGAIGGVEGGPPGIALGAAYGATEGAQAGLYAGTLASGICKFFGAYGSS